MEDDNVGGQDGDVGEGEWSESENDLRPLVTGVIVGVILCSIGIIVVLIAWAVGGIPAIILAVVAAALFLAGLWLALLNGFWLVILRWAERYERKTGER